MRTRSSRRNAVVATWLVALAIATSACSSGSSSPEVANLGSSNASTTLSGGAGNSGAAAPTAAQLAAMTKWAACVRKHGLPDFPDPPYSNGELNSLGYTKSSPKMEAADNSCHALALAAGAVPSQAEMEAHDKQMLKISVCMRDHGITDFPDPNSDGGFMMSPSLADTPGYAAAAKKCDGPPGAPARSGTGPSGGSGSAAGSASG